MTNLADIAAAREDWRTWRVKWFEPRWEAYLSGKRKTSPTDLDFRDWLIEHRDCKPHDLEIINEDGT